MRYTGSMSGSSAQPTVIARPSVASLFLQMQVNGQALATGTGFLVRRDDRTFLLTNRHNVRGRHNVTDQILSPTGAEPDELLVLQNVRGKVGEWVSQTLPLRDQNDKPTWHEHPRFGGQVDAVAFDVGDVSDYEVYAHEAWAVGPQLAFGPSTPLSIVGSHLVLPEEGPSAYGSKDQRQLSRPSIGMTCPASS